MAQTSDRRKGAFWPVSFPLFHGAGVAGFASETKSFIGAFLLLVRNWDFVSTQYEAGLGRVRIVCTDYKRFR